MANEGATLLPVNATPQEGEEGKSSRFSSSRITVGFGIVLLAGVGVAVATTHRSRTQASTANLATAGEGVGLDQIKKYEPGWYFYKAAFIAAKGDYKEAWRFIENFSGGYSCEAVNLGVSTSFDSHARETESREAVRCEALFAPPPRSRQMSTRSRRLAVRTGTV